MNPAATVALPGELSASQRAALLKLLVDEDPEVFRAVRDRIISEGPRAAGWLRDHLLSNEPLLRARARAIVNHFARQTADVAFLAFCLNNGEELPLEEGAWLLAKTRYPEVNTQAYEAVLDDYAGEVRAKLEGLRKPKEVLTTLNHVLFDGFGFVGNEQNYYDPQNSYLNCVLDRRTGNPINLCLLYMLVGKRLQLPVVGIGLPGHFICRYQTTAAEIYIDAFSRGKLLAKADCVQYLLQGNYSVRDEYLAPVSPRRMLLRICGNLHQIYLHLENEAEATRFQRYMVALAKQL